MSQSVSQDAAKFLLDDFQSKVDSSIRDYKRITTTPYRYRPGIKAYHGQRKLARVKKESTKKMERRIGKVLQQSEVRESLSRALQKVTDDVFEISKAITPVLLTLIATGKLDIEPVPLIFAGIALTIVRMGVSAFSNEHQIKTKAGSSRKSTKGKK